MTRLPDDVVGDAYTSNFAWETLEELSDNWRVDATFEPELDAAAADRQHERWLAAVERSREWATE